MTSISNPESANGQLDLEFPRRSTVTITITDSFLAPGQVTVKFESDPPLTDTPTPAQLLALDMLGFVQHIQKEVN